MSDTPSRPQAVVYRMVMPEHTCPFGLKSIWLLRRKGFAIDDRWLRTRDEVDAVQRELQVKTTPQTFLDGVRIGGWDDLRRHFGWPVRDADQPSYVPVAVVIATALLLALAWHLAGSAPAAPAGWASMARTGENAVALFMCLLAMLKLQDVETFSSMFLNYDLLARRWVPYAYLYPFAEFAAGWAMLARHGLGLAIPLALFIGGVGAASVVKAVYIDRRELRCACVGGGSTVPLGFVSLTENLAMVFMAVWMAR